MKTSLLAGVLTAGLLGCGCALAQVASAPSPLSATPLAIGSSTRVGPVGIPLGATELAAPGISPAPSASTGCTTTGTNAASTSTFDGGGMAGTSASPCASIDTGVATMSAAPTLGRGAGIPLGSTEIASPGLSPLPPSSMPFVSPLTPPAASTPMTMGVAPASAATPCPVTGAFTDQSTARGAATASSGSGASVSGC
jgi:hypothetical protein